MRKYLLPLLLITLSAPALALTAPPPKPSTQAVTAERLKEVVDQYSAWNRCAFAKPGYRAALSVNTFTAIQQAYWFAVDAAAKSNRAKFEEYAATIDTEIGRLSGQGWGC